MKSLAAKSLVPKILIIEDEESIRKVLRVSLESHPFEVLESARADDGIRAAVTLAPQLILLDLGLPDQSGLTVIRAIRARSLVPIIILSAQNDEAIKIEALDLGANDYVTKPFSVPELLARIRVTLRPLLTLGVPPPVLSCGAIELDVEAHVVRAQGQGVKLTATEFNIIHLLLKNAEKVVTHRQLLKEVWGPNSVEHTQYLRVYLAQVRKKLGRAGEQIQTETGIGYRLVETPTKIGT